MEWIERLFQFDNPAEQRKFLSTHQARLDPEQVSLRLKEQADRYLRVDIQRALQTSDLLIEFGEANGHPQAVALGYLAEANARQIGLGEYEKALGLYDSAAGIYKTIDQEVERATSQIGKIGALLFLGRYEEALEIGGWAGEVLESAGSLLPLARLTSNLAVVYYRLGDDARALNMFDQAQDRYLQVEAGKGPGWLRAELNRAIVLRNLGRFEDSISASQTAHKYLLEHGHVIDAARAQQGLALTYFVLGKYNETLAILDQVREVFLSDERQRDAILTELFISDCLLELRRFAEVLEKCQQVRAGFAELGTVFEVTLAILNESIAYTGLTRYQEALQSLEEARRSFEAQGNANWVSYCDLEAADVHLKLQQYPQALASAEACLAAISDQPFKEAQARLIAAQAHLEMGAIEKAEALIAAVLELSAAADIPSLSYMCHHLKGKIAERAGRLEEATGALSQAIHELERLQGRLMVEFRSDFLADKQSLYEDMVVLQLDLKRPAIALDYAEKAKSRALQDLLAHRLDLSIQVRAPRDQELVDQIVQLRADRDRLYRRWESSAQEEMAQRGWSPYDASRHDVQSEVLAIEKKITSLWHQLLVRNADYARDAFIWQNRTEPFQDFIDEDTLVLEYFIARGDLFAFTITKDRIAAQPLTVSKEEIERLIGLVRLNFQVVPRSPAEKYPQLARNAQGLLAAMAQHLVQPLADLVEAYPRLIIVPHGPLHYLPFHALYQGDTYLLETHAVSYLPGVNFLRFLPRDRPMQNRNLFVGHTYGMRLPNTLHETKKIAALWNTSPVLEEAASAEYVKQASPDCRLIHLATHGDFRPDNPLFSGLALEDSWLTTLDIFNLELQASLITLSACDTGRSVIGGGDELLGLMRAFLSAGAASLVLSLWAVEDRSTAALMENFYRGLSAGQTKREALRAAQIRFIRGVMDHEENGQPDYSHPYFWAPFMLVGDPGLF